MPRTAPFIVALVSVAPLASSAWAQELPEQARDRHEYDLIDVDWNVRLDPAKAAIEGSVVNTLKPTKDKPWLVFDCANLNVTKVQVDGKDAAFQANGVVLAVEAPGLKKGKTAKVRIEYNGLPEAGVYFVAAGRTFPATTDIVYTQGEMEDNRYWLPTYDSPNDKATSRGSITVPAGWSVLSNGKNLGNEGSTWRWAMDKPHATYLISFVAGPYTEVPDGTNPVPVSIWTPKGLEPWGKNAFGGTDAIIRFYGKLTGVTYPWPKYAQSAVADFMFGGMENVSATTQTITALFPDSVKGTRDSTGLDAHELAHQWFGDFITTPRWDDIWVNEGWATFLPHFWTREKEGQEAYDLERYNTIEFAKGAMRGAPNRSMVWNGWTVPMDMFDGYAYPGGAARMFALMHQFGEKKFWSATKRYLNEYGLKNVDTDQFFKSYSKALGADLSGFETQWFRTPSAPPKLSVRRDGNAIVIDQTAATDFSLPLDIWVLSPDDKWTKKTVTAKGDVALAGFPAGPVLVDAEVFLPIDVEYPGASKEDLARLWKAAPNSAQKKRLAGAYFGSLTQEEKNAAVRNETSWRLKADFVYYTNDAKDLTLWATDTNERLANATLGRLGDIPGTDTTKALLRSVWESKAVNPDLRETALQSLYALTKDASLIEAAWKEPHFLHSFETWALSTWASVDPNRARELALDAINGPAVEPIRLTAISVLGRVKDKPGDRRAFNALAAMMTERSNGPLRAAISALATYGDKAAIPLLEKRKDHGLHFVRGDVANALQRLGG